MRLASTKFFHWAVWLIMMFAAPAFRANAGGPTPPPPGCPLPPPVTVTISDVTASSLTAAWTAVPSAVLYKITVTDLNTNLLLTTVYTSNTNKFIGGLPSNTPLRVGVSASRCSFQIPMNFGYPKNEDTRTLKYIVGDEIVNRCNLTPFPMPLPAVIHTDVPINSAAASDWYYYEAKVEGTKSQASWACRISIATSCLDALSGAAFYVLVDTGETFNMTYSVTSSTELVEFKCQDVLIFTLKTPKLSFGSGPTSASTEIIFNTQLPAGTEITRFYSISSCLGTRPANFMCGGGDAGLMGEKNEDRNNPNESGVLPGRTASLAPNPTADKTNLYFTLLAPSEVVVNLYDATGRLVAQVAPEMPMAAGKNQVTLDLSSLPPGFFLVQLRSAEGQETLPLVRQ